MRTQTLEVAGNINELRIELHKQDCDLIIVFPGGKTMTVQVRPSNADCGGYRKQPYNGSLDIILPKNQRVICWKGDDMKDAPAASGRREHERLAKQLVTELPGDYES